MLISNIINDSFGLLSKQLRFYCWHFRRSLDHRQRQELIQLLYEQHFEQLANRIKILNQSSVTDCKQQVSKLLFEHSFNRNRRHQLIQLIESGLVDIDVRLDNYGRTLLHRSAYNLDVELVKILIDHDVNIRLRDYAGNTALHIAIQSYRNGAVMYGNGPDVVQNLSSIIKLLLDADNNIRCERYKRKRIKLLSEGDDRSANRLMFDESLQSSEEENIGSNRISMAVLPTCFSPKRKESSSGFNNAHSSKSASSDSEKQNDKSISPTIEPKELEFPKQLNQPDTPEAINPILLEDASSHLVDTKNAFGRTALHYCVLVVGEQHLAHFVRLLISYGADIDATDTRMKTPLYCLVKRQGISAIRQKCQAISHLIDGGCDDLGLAIDSKQYFTRELMKNLEKNLSTILQTKPECPEPIFTHSTFKRVPSLKHIARLNLVKLQDAKLKQKRQVKLILPAIAPASLDLYVNRRILDQSELF